MGVGICARSESFETIGDAADIIPREPTVNSIVSSGYYALDLMQFFTAGPNQCKAWTIRTGTSGPKAGGTIHGDFEKSFISVEVIKPDDISELGSEGAVKKAGKIFAQGPEYIIEDADILTFKFSTKGKK
jgi:ribosome-binding ATPase YchF (GTP1/OBG family)